MKFYLQAFQVSNFKEHNSNSKIKFKCTGITSQGEQKQDSLPRMAKRLEENTINGSRVTPKTAGIESTY